MATERLLKQLKNLKGLTPHSLLAGAYKLQGYSQENAPVKTGFLKNSFESVENNDGAEMRVNTNYAYFVEVGTSKWAGKPYIRPAIDSHESDITKAIAKQVEIDIRSKL